MAVERVAMITFRDQAQRPIVTFRRMDGVVTVETWAQGVHGETAVDLAELRQLVEFLGDMAELPWGEDTPRTPEALTPQEPTRVAHPIPQPAMSRPTRPVPAYVERPTWTVSEVSDDEAAFPITGVRATS